MSLSRVKFDRFVNTGLHDEKWAKKAYAVIPSKVFGQRFWAVTSEDHNHAELKLIKKANQRIQKQPANPVDTPKEITIYMSYSSCEQCGNALIAFYEDCKTKFGRDTTMEIVIAALWYIPRPSCRTRGCRGKHMEPNDFHTEGNKRSISMLTAYPGISVRPFASQDWTDLGLELGVDQGYIQSQAARREREDTNLAEDFETLFRSPDQYCRMKEVTLEDLSWPKLERKKPDGEILSDDSEDEAPREKRGKKGGSGKSKKRRRSRDNDSDEEGSDGKERHKKLRKQFEPEESKKKKKDEEGGDGKESRKKLRKQLEPEESKKKEKKDEEGGDGKQGCKKSRKQLERKASKKKKNQKNNNWKKEEVGKKKLKIADSSSDSD